MNQDYGAAFGETRTCLEEARERYFLVERIGHFVQSGLRDFDSRYTLSLAPLQQAIAARFTDTLAMGYSSRGMTQSEARRRACKAFLACFKDIATRFGCDHLKPVSFTGWEEEAALLQSLYGSAEEASDDASAETAQNALRIAKENRERAQLRVILLYCLGAHLPRMTESANRETAEAKAYDAASKYLWQQVATFDRHVMMFSIIVGGAALADCRRSILSENLSRGHSLMPYLSRDGVLPSRWSSDIEDKFLASLQG